MNEYHRFTSLKGAGRKWLSQRELDYDVEEELLDELDDDGSFLSDGGSYEWGYDGDPNDWGPVQPRRGSLAKLGDVIRDT